MTPAKVEAVLQQLNARIFKGNLQYRAEPWPLRAARTWVLEYVSGGRSWMRRCCWLASRRTFQMRHGGGGDFAWWVDCAVVNEIAVHFSGTLVDDGCAGALRVAPNRFDDLHVFLADMTKHIPPGAAQQYLDDMRRMLVPPEFHKPAAGVV